jgi:iron complex transport system substrate-binding protein
MQVVNVQKSGFIASFPELFDAIRQIGEATGRTSEAQKLVDDIKSKLDAVATRFGRIDDARRARVFVEIEESPLMTAGAGSFIDDLIRRAGGTNVAHETSTAYPRINPEQVIAWNPEVILVAHNEQPGAAAERLAGHIGWSDLAAVRNRRIIDDIDADLLFRPGPRLAEGVDALARRLHPKQP